MQFFSDAHIDFESIGNLCQITLEIKKCFVEFQSRKYLIFLLNNYPKN